MKFSLREPAGFPAAAKKLNQRLVKLPRSIKQLLLAWLDAGLCVGSLWLALALRLDTFAPPIPVLTKATAISVAIAIPIFWFMGVYGAVLRHSGGRSLGIIAKAVALYGAFFASVITVVGMQGVPRSVGIAQPMFLFLLLACSRWLIRSWLREQIAGRRPGNNQRYKVVLIYGAGVAGRQLAANLAVSSEWWLAGFLDDDETIWGATIDGRPVHNPALMATTVQKHGIDEVWLAMPGVITSRKKEIIETVRPLGVHVRTLPSLSDITSGRVRLSDLRELDVHDLLGRDPVEPNCSLLNQTVTGKTVLVTGAGGSTGSELSRQILAWDPSCLILVDHSEYALYTIHHELLEASKKQAIFDGTDSVAGVNVNYVCSSSQLVPILGSVTDETLMRRVFQRWQPQTVFHAAAFKHVPMAERNISATILNNVWGTYTCVRQALAIGTQHFILVSTDKAVRPTNIMGASKRLSELIVQAIAATEVSAGRSFAAVRFGNVLGSSGSVVPLFRDQIAQGGPITLTHLEITRFFMTIPEAAQLVLQAAGLARGGEVFVLDMGAPVRVYDLVRRMVELSGLTVKDHSNPGGGIEITVTGLRPGEKLYEELLIGGSSEPTSHPKIMKAHETFPSFDQLEDGLEEIQQALSRSDVEAIRGILCRLVPEYNPTQDIISWEYLDVGKTI